ncbi:MAG: type I-E CRISPR-associated protein Cas6/Cse3/CasE [Verrucomicrobia bacterium]|nr:type I-E CRISPR-associated protein Cas6/Cse3/CasE [Verrucomicrobiota bacterium]
MSYLTQILVPYELAVRQLKIRDSYDWHQRVWQAFKGQDDAKREFLSRVDEIDEAYRLLIISPVEPTKPDWCPTDCFKTKAIPEDFFAAGTFRFSLLVNPTKKLVVRNEAGERKKNGRRIALTKREDLLAWMQRKAEAGGFDIGDPENLRTIPKPRSYFQKAGMQGVHFAVEFQGTLTVTDPARLRATFTTGIGSAKAFGFGMLCLAPLP